MRRYAQCAAPTPLCKSALVMKRPRARAAPKNLMSHNTFGHLFRVTTFGESHGPAIGCVVDGCPPRIPLTEADIQPYLDKRRPGQSRFTTQRREPDAVKILSGVFADEASGSEVTTGTPIALLIENVDQRSKDYSEIKDKYRPGHADYTYDVKYGIRDYRGGGRAVGARDRGARRGRRDRAQDRARHDGARRADPDGAAQDRPRALGLGRGRRAIRSSAPTPQAAEFFEDYLDDVRKRGSSVGAVIEVVAEGVPAGLGAPVYGKLDADLAAALMSINAVKGVEIGAGFAAAALTGEENADEMRMGNDGKPLFLSNHAGGILGGISTGQPIVARFAVKPTSSILTPRAHRRPLRQRDRDRHQGPPRPLRRHPRRADRRGDDGVRPRRSLSAPSRPGRRQPGLAVAEPSGGDPLAGHAKRDRRRMTDTHQRVDDVVEAFARGEIVVVTDDDDRENEGDLFVAASLCTPEKMAFIIRHTSGIVCAPLVGRGGQAPASRSDGGAQRRAARHRLHGLGRRAARADHRHLGGGAHQHGARARQRQQRRRPISCGPATSFR